MSPGVVHHGVFPVQGSSSFLPSQDIPERNRQRGGVGMGLALCWLGWVGVGLLVGLFVCLLRMVLLWLQLEPCPELQGMFFLGNQRTFML